MTARRYCTDVQNAHLWAAAGIDDKHSGQSFTGVGSSGVGLNRCIRLFTGATTKK